MASGLTIGQLAKAGGVNIQTVRFYERLHLLAPTARTPSGYRVYGEEAVRRLRFIKNAQALGFTLREILELLNLRVSSTTRCGDVQRRAEAKLALAQVLKDLIRACRAGQPTDRCPILKSLEEKRGSDDGNRKAKR